MTRTTLVIPVSPLLCRRSSRCGVKRSRQYACEDGVPSCAAPTSPRAGGGGSATRSFLTNCALRVSKYPPGQVERQNVISAWMEKRCSAAKPAGAVGDRRAHRFRHRHQRRNVRSLIPRSSAASNLLRLPSSQRPKTSRNFNMRTASRTCVRLIESLPWGKDHHGPDRSCAT
jgi:hypothetical protein